MFSDAAAPAIEAAIFRLAAKPPPALDGPQPEGCEETLTEGILSKDGTPHRMHLAFMPHWKLFTNVTERQAVNVRAPAGCVSLGVTLSCAGSRMRPVARSLSAAVA